MPQHNCLNHLVMRSGYDTQPHGESTWNEWNQCSVCERNYSDAEVAAMWEAEPANASEESLAEFARRTR